MEDLKQYILSVMVSAVVCAIVRCIGVKSSHQRVLTLLSGLYLSISILSPLSSLNPERWLQSASTDIFADAASAAAVGEDIQRESLSAIIKEKTAAYILDKAAQWNLAPDVTVYLSEDTIPVPISVEIRGSVSPYGKQQLTKLLEEELGIAKENQLWIG